VSTRTDWDVVVGYADRLSARPGDRLRVMVSCAGELDAEVVRLPGAGPAPVAIERIGAQAVQPVRTGSRVEVAHHPALRPDDGLAVSVWIWLAPGAPGDRRRALVSSWGDDGDAGWALVLDEQGRPRFEVAAGGRLEAATARTPLPLDSWWRLEGALEPAAGEISIARHDRDGDAVDLVREATTLGAPGGAPGPLLLAAELRAGAASAHLDGKLEAPQVAAGPDGERTIASWELGSGRTGAVPDRGPHGLEGRCINGPLRAVTGRRWTGDVHDWRCASEGYEAMHFHADAVDDLGWEPTLELEVAGSCPSGVYAAVLRAGGCEDIVPFVVRRGRDEPPAAHAVLLPSFTYLAYSCERGTPADVGSTRNEDDWVARNRLRSLYDRYDDGCGAYEASLRRPLTQLRPGYASPQHGGPHGLAQDLGLLAFLERRGIGADVLTDHDVHAEGAEALAGHRVVITGAHPEYATPRLLDALEAHVDSGGSLAYLGGNGLNGPVSVDPQRPHVAELRRTDTQGLAWQALPGEHHHAATGDYGGDWRRRERPEHRFLGVGLSAFGFSPAAAYERVIDAGHPAARIVFAGLDADAPIGHPGRVLDGAAGFEVDNFDPVLGSPPDAIWLACAAVPDYEVWPDDVRDGPAAAPKRRADMVVRLAAGGGTVFSVGSIAWTGCLDGDDLNPVARVTENVLRELAAERPFEGARE
jgi:N,N-dimethylformamidase